jgi:ADP-ribosyl-[dinitrogen reductase] hydrolase
VPITQNALLLKSDFTFADCEAVLTHTSEFSPASSPALPTPLSPEARQDRAVAAYLGFAIGDALGATVEFMTPREIEVEYGLHKDIIGGGWLKLKPGQITDDTQMSLALGDTLLACRGHVDALAVAQAFDGWMRTKPPDIGNTVRRNLMAFRQTGDPQARPSEHDAGNGAAMRILPVALATLGQPEMLVAAALKRQGHITHNNVLSDAACEALAFMVQDMLNGLPITETAEGRVVHLITQHPTFLFRKKRIENPSGYVVETVQAVFQALFDTDSFESCLIDVVNRGGDADTTGAIAGMLAGARYGLRAIPERWLAALEPTILERCRNQALALLQLSE